MIRSRWILIELLVVACYSLPGCDGGNNNHAAPTPTASNTPTLTHTATLPPTPTATSAPTATFSATPSSSPTLSATPTLSPTVTISPTPSTTPSPSATPTLGPLGTRHFLINPARSPFEAVLGQNFKVPIGAFTGFLDLEAEQPDPATGVATINVVDASDYIFADAQLASLVLCIKPQKHVTAAGVVACNGGFALGFGTTQDHNIGEVGVDGYTADMCTSTCSPGTADNCGQIESRNQICAAGMVGCPADTLEAPCCRTNVECDTMPDAGDGMCGIGEATCTDGKVGSACKNDSDCDSPGMTDGVCGIVKPHPAVCNGPLTPTQLTDPSPPGSVIIAPNPQFGLTGLPVELTIEQRLPCGDEGPGQQVTFALTSDVSRATILHFSNTDQTVTNSSPGKPFSCANWQDQDGPGALVLSVAALDTNPMGGGDVITVFNFNGQP